MYKEEDRGYTTPCWTWQGRLLGAGKYPVVWYPEKSTWANGDYPAHKKAWEDINGPMPEGLVPDHLCSIHTCVRPDHIEAVTQQENTLRGEGPAARNATKTHCPQSHPYDDENTYITTAGDRRCRACQRAYRKKRREEGFE